MKGKLVVFEGTDGSGKKTQAELLVQHLKNTRVPHTFFDFPRYTESFFGALAGELLSGKLGVNVSGKLAVLPFACDRWLVKEEISRSLSEGKLVVSNRYTASSAVYQAAKLETQKLEQFMDWVFKLEQEIIGLPTPTITMFFHVPVPVAQKLLESRGMQKDMYEKNVQMLTEVEKLYAKLGSKFTNWNIIECTRSGMMRPREEIHKEVLDVLVKNGIL